MEEWTNGLQGGTPLLGNLVYKSFGPRLYGGSIFYGGSIYSIHGDFEPSVPPCRVQDWDLTKIVLGVNFCSALTEMDAHWRIIA